ncbi:hypothetical protein E2C01_021493 [Portunus trituberculatus]|uniref:Uncharacterized protein n=1 Tax=Portunus trituberculatus TaxID=210409 RepID=A0A5B7E2N9_PORTR|nr:hypothetical protein [Portunus trituberculatus]
MQVYVHSNAGSRLLAMHVVMDPLIGVGSQTMKRVPLYWKKQDKLLLDSRKKTSRNQRMNHEMKVTVEEASLSLFLHHPKLDDNGKYTLEAFLPGTNITTTTTMFLMIPGRFTEERNQKQQLHTC